MSTTFSYLGRHSTVLEQNVIKLNNQEQEIGTLLNDIQTMESNYNALSSKYNNLCSQYNTLNTQYDNMSSSINLLARLPHGI